MSFDNATLETSHSLDNIVGREYGVDPVSSSFFQDLTIPLTLSPTFQVSWNRRDLLTYALGIGATPAEQQFINGA